MARSDTNIYLLAQNESAAGPSVAVRGGKYMFMVDGTLGSGNVSLQVQTPSDVWSDIFVFSGLKVSFTSLPGSHAAIDLPPCNVRLGVSSASASGVNAYLVGLG